MKVIVQKDLLKRLQFASNNGSKVATMILSELERDADSTEVLNSNANFFESKRIISHGQEERYGYTVIRIIITCCSKDINDERFPDHGNPDAPYLSENRTELTVTKFAKMFNAVYEAYMNDELHPCDFDFLESVIRINSNISIDLVDTVDGFRHAYSENYYYNYAEDNESTLHKSCMRHEDCFLPSRAADFYVNFCRAKILVASTEDGQVLGRAVVWDNVWIASDSRHVSLIDRNYFCFKAIGTMMIEQARKLGITLRKSYNTYDTKLKFTVLTDFGDHTVGQEIITYATVEISSHRWHKRGAPYVDTFTYVCKDEDSDYLYLSNTDGYNGFTIADLSNTGGYAYQRYYVCPVCGGKSDNSMLNGICDNCKNDIILDTPSYGLQFKCGFRRHDGIDLPNAFFDEEGNLKPSFTLHNRLMRLFD